MKNDNEKPSISTVENYVSSTVQMVEAKRIDRSAYRPDPSVNQSFLKKVLDHGYNTAVKMVENADDPTDDMLIGTAMHAILSKDPAIISNILVVPKIDRRTKEGKAAEASYEVFRNEGKTIVQEHLWKVAEELSVGVDRVVTNALEPEGEMFRELSLTATASLEYQMPQSYAGYFTRRDEQGTVDEEWDKVVKLVVPVKGQLDAVFVPKDENAPIVVIDYKSVQTNAIQKILRKSRDDMWRLQAALYSDLAAAYFKRPALNLYVTAGKDNLNPRAFMFSQKSLEEGRQMLAHGLIRYRVQSFNKQMPDEEYFGITVI